MLTDQHYVTVRKYRDKYKIVVIPGYDPTIDKTSVGCSSHDEKLDCNVSRARAKIYEYAYCNDWQWFVTITLDKLKYDRYNLEKFHKDLTKWLNNYKRKIGNKIDFLLIPETHEDGAWHIHGLLNGLPVEFLKQFQHGDRMSKEIADRVRSGEVIYNWLDCAKKFGFVTLTSVRSHAAVSAYVTKYATKDLSRLVNEVRGHMYYVSRGLNTSDEVKKGFVYTGNMNMSFDFEGKFCSVKWVKDLADVYRVFDLDDTVHNIDLNIEDFEELEL